MRHGKKFNHLGRTKPHREAMLSNMACSLIQHKRINTTLAKAKSLRTFIEPLITRSKTDSTHSRRMVFRQLKNKEAVADLFRDVAPKVADRPGGYLRIIRTDFRLGDNAVMCMVELVDFNELMVKDLKQGKSKRSRRGGKAKTSGKTAVSETVEEKTEVVVDETTSEVEIKEEVIVEEPKVEEPKTEEPKADADEPKEEDAKESDKKE